MDTGSSSDLIAALVTFLGLGSTGLIGFWLVRRARASRRRLIDASAERLSVEKRRHAPKLADLDDDAPDDAPAVKEDSAPALAESSPPEPKPAEPPSAVALVAASPQLRDKAALKTGLSRTRGGFIARLGEVFVGRKEIDAALLLQIEKILLTADIGVHTTARMVEELRTSLGRQSLADADAIWDFLRKRAVEILKVQSRPLALASAQPFVLLVIGVNGSGKTTTIGKLGHKWKEQGSSVLLAAGDTFRAAATEQLEVWADRMGAPVVRGKEGADPSSVLFEAVKRAQAESIQVVIADTAGRLHTKQALMDELEKVRRVLAKAMPGAPHETWLVIDAGTGQNAIAQAKVFTQAMAVTGIVLTKLDGTAKGGVILGIADELKLPVRYIGVGERIEDLREFDADEFVDALFER